MGKFIHGFDKFINESNNDELYNKAYKLYTLGKDTTGNFMIEYESLYNELTNGVTAETDFALKHYKNADDFAKYYVNRINNGDHLFPKEHVNKTDSEMHDYAVSHGKK